MRILELNESTLEQRDAMAQAFEKNKVTTGIKSIDTVFTSLVKGSVYCVCAATGVGKTTFLLATAKKMASEGKKVIYLSIEQSLEQLVSELPRIEPNLTIIEFNNEWEEVMNYCDIFQPDIICYDYIGARLDDWDKLVKEADNLAEIAKRLNIVIFSALQAVPDIDRVYSEDRENPLLFTNNFVAFSKGIITKVAGAAYIIRDNGVSMLYCMKNRYAAKFAKPIRMEDLDYKNKSWKINERNPLENYQAKRIR